MRETVEMYNNFEIALITSLSPNFSVHNIELHSLIFYLYPIIAGRMKNWKIVSGIMPITMVDMAGQIMRIIGALINLLPPLVPLGKEDMFV